VEIDPIDYYRAAIERLEQAQNLYRRDSTGERTVNHHALAYYTAGVAVECLLRAFITRRTREFEGRHNLDLLFQQSGLLGFDPGSTRLAHLSDAEVQAIKRDLGGAVGRVNRVWNNALRYASEERLRSHLYGLGLHQGIKGDILKENLRRLLEAARRIIDRGIILWEALPNSPNG
jgi:hypothetical protein